MISPLSSQQKKSTLTGSPYISSTVVNLVKLFGKGQKETFLRLIIFGLARRLEASRNLPAGAGNLWPVTSGNSRQSLPAEN